MVFVKLEGIQGVASTLAFKILYFKTALYWTHSDLILVVLALEDGLEKFKASLASSLEPNRSCQRGRVTWLAESDLPTPR